jgi:2-desacetyl-2-hydroxyethyl bacteriochlorophyllide A dehydrogenase
MTGYGTTKDGGFAEYCVVDASQVYRLGDNTTFAQGAMAEPVACCLHGIDMCDIEPGHQVVVIGGGMIGMLMLQLAKLAGAARVALLEPVEKKREMGRKLGADVCIDPLHEDVKARLKEAGMTWIRTVIECAGLPATMEQAIDLAGNKGTVMMFGLTKPDAQIAVKPFQIFQKELTLRASFINPHTQHRALQLIDSGRLDVESMVCRTIGLEELEHVLADPALRAEGKYIVVPECR